MFRGAMMGAYFVLAFARATPIYADFDRDGTVDLVEVCLVSGEVAQICNAQLLQALENEEFGSARAVWDDLLARREARLAEVCFHSESSEATVFYEEKHSFRPYLAARCSYDVFLSGRTGSMAMAENQLCRMGMIAKRLNLFEVRFADCETQ